MTQKEKDRLQYMIDVMQAYKEGKEIESSSLFSKVKTWSLNDSPRFDWANFDYRIKPEPPKPKYRPFESAEEVMEAIKEHGCWVKGIEQDYLGYYQIVGIYSNGIDTQACDASFEWALKIFQWADGTPFGKLIEE